jgi:hypothetical protein
MNAYTNTNKRRQPGRKAADIQLAWKQLAPTAVFAGKTLEDIESALQALAESNEDLKIRDQARSAAIKRRDEKLQDLIDLTRTVVKGVQGHPEHGEDSPLYRAMGFVPFSERRSGLTRRKKAGADGTTGDQKETAV